MLESSLKKPLQKERFSPASRYRYLLYLPAALQSVPEHPDTTKWPLVVFLHGAGEMGKHFDRIKKPGMIPHMIENGLPDDPKLRDKMFPFIVVSPQCNRYNRFNSHDLKLFLDEVLAEWGEYIDKTKMYLTGLSMGGFATFDMAMSYPDLWAAIAPVCGGGCPEEAYKIKDIPTYIVHGAKDDIVPMLYSQTMFDSLKRAGAPNVELHIHPEAKHDSWTPTYTTERGAPGPVFEWFLEWKKEKSASFSVSANQDDADRGI